MLRLKAVNGTEIIGFIAADIKRIKRMAWIATICVHPAYRRQGMGAGLLQLCEDMLTVPRIRLSVRASNSAAISLYNHRGYSQVDLWKRYYKGSEDAVVMQKELK